MQANKAAHIFFTGNNCCTEAVFNVGVIIIGIRPIEIICFSVTLYAGKTNNTANITIANKIRINNTQILDAAVLLG